MKKNLKSNLFMWKYNLAKPGAQAYHQEVLANQHLSPTDLAALNWSRTCQLLHYAYCHVPYYRKTFTDLSLDPRDITEPKYYEQVPVLTRQDLQAHWSEMISDEARPGDLNPSTTGGSTGAPVKVFHQRKVVRAAMQWRMLSWWGLGPECDIASVYRDLGTTRKACLLNRLVAWPGRKILLNAVAFSPKDIDRFLTQFKRVRPPLVHGYVGALDYVADYMQQHKITVPAPEVVWTTSSPLTEIQKRKIGQAFGAPVCDQYGCCEVYWLAAECPAQSGLHMFTDVRRFEFLDDRGLPVPRGKMGQIAITDLENKYFPLIRYLNGDQGRALDRPCPCGISLPLMDKVRGRVSDNLNLPSGACISGEYLTTLFDDHPDAVKQFQVYQKSDYSIVIKAVARQSKTRLTPLLETICTQIGQQYQHEVPVQFQIIDQIPPTRGKLKFVISDIA